ncbi:MAG: HpcH/HpaI aldolase/citrate lyase family protein [Pseudomonadota bacterium]
MPDKYLKNNDFLHAIRSFKPQLGTWNMINSPHVSEIIASTGFDWSVVDMEHSPNEVERVMHQLQAFAAYSTMPMVRPPTVDAVITKRLMDIGSQSLLFPMVNSVDQAEEAVAGTRYPPRGVRGMAGVQRANQFGRLTDYLSRVEEETCVIVQAETVTAIEHVEAIAAVDGVDGVFFGPADLATDMGFRGDAQRSEVWDVIRTASQKVRALGKPTGTLVSTPEHAKDLFSAGMTFVSVGTDAGFLARRLDTVLAELKG